MTFYLFLSDRHGSNSGARWAIMGIAIKVAQSVSCAQPFKILSADSHILAISQIGLRM